MFINTILSGKEEKRDQKVIIEESSSTLVDPTLVTVVEVAKDSQQSSSTPSKAEKGQSSEESKRSTKDRKSDSAGKDKGKSVKKSPSKASKLTTDNKLEQLNQKWSERCSRLETMLLSKTLSQPEPVFSSVAVSPAQTPPVGAVDNNQPFFQPQNNQPTTNQQKPTNSLATDQQQPAHRPKTDNRPRSTDQHLQLTNPPATRSQQPAHRPKSGNRPTGQHSPTTDQTTGHSPSASISPA